MISPDEIVKGLPPVRDDEPPSLRRDIVDEIADHLQCKLRRELLGSGGDEILARRRVLEKFGDPRHVARKLWFQAMWSRIMTQRLLVGMSLCSMIATVSIVVVLGWIVQQQQYLQQEQQRINVALIEQLGKLVPISNPAPNAGNVDWNRLQVKVNKGAADGPAAEGFLLNVSQVPRIGEPSSGGYELTALIDKSGIADCGLVKPGKFVIHVTSPWNELTRIFCFVQPGKDQFEQIITPIEPPGSSSVTVQIAEPPDLGSNSTRLLFIQISPTSERDVASQTWEFNERAPKLGILMIPQTGIWVTKSVSDNTVDLVRNAKWEKYDPLKKFDFPIARYSVMFWLTYRIQQPTREGDQPNSEVRIDDSRLMPLVETQLELSAEQISPVQWKIDIPDEIVEAFRKAPDWLQGGGGFF